MEEKKNGIMGNLCKLALVIGGIYAAMLAVGRFVAKKAQELECKNEGMPEKNYLAVMNGQMIKIGREPLEKITLRSYLGGVTFDLTEAEFTEETEIIITGLMSGVVVKVPPMVRVKLEGTNILSGFANMVPEYETEGLPLVHVHAECLMSGIAVQMVPEAKKGA